METIITGGENCNSSKPVQRASSLRAMLFGLHENHLPEIQTTERQLGFP